MNFFKLSLVCLSILSTGASAIDRKPMVVAANKIFPVLCAYVEQVVETKNLAVREIRILRQVTELAKSGKVPLIFSQNTEEFNIVPGEPERLMRSTGVYDSETNQLIDAGSIFVNEPLLNQADQRIDLNFLIKLLFHEYAHKTGEESWGVRDRLANFFTHQIDPFIIESKLSDSLQLTVLSLPTSRINKALDVVSINRPMSTNLILVRRGDEIADITENLVSKMDTSTEMLRSIWVDLNRALLGVAQMIMSAIDDHVKPELRKKAIEMKAFMEHIAPDSNIDFSGMDDFLKAFEKAPSEIRILELGEAQAADLGENTFVSLRSTYFITRTDVKSFHVNVTGFPYKDTYPVPTTIYFSIPKSSQIPLSEIQFDVQVRPDVDYQSVAKVKSVIRQGSDVSMLKVWLGQSEKIKKLKDVRVSLRFASGFQLIKASSVEEAEGGWSISFEFPSALFVSGVSVLADSLLIDGEHSVYLDRLISVSSQSGEVSQEVVDIVSDSVGFWGNQKGVSAFKKEFDRKEMVYYLDGLNMEAFSFNPSNFTVQFQLSKNVKLREVRVYLHRQMFLMESEGFGKSVKGMPYQGRMIPISNEGANLIEKKEFQEILSIPANSIAKVDSQTYRASLVAPMKFDFEMRRPGLAYGPPLAWPIMVEVVTEDLQVLRHHFSKLMTEDAVCGSFLDL